jgi:hypothetical protein
VGSPQRNPRAFDSRANRVGVVTPMLKADLVAHLTAVSKKLGADPITDRMIKDWIDEGLLDKSKPKGNRRGQPPTWTYSDETVQRAERIVELRTRGVRRASALRINLWIDGFALLFEDMKLALKWEFGRALARLRRRRTWSFDGRFRRHTPAGKLDKETKRIEPVDADLAKAGFAPPLDLLLRSGSELYWGSGERGPIPGSFEGLFSNLLAGAASETGISFVPPAGLFGDAEEISNAGLSDLGRTTERDLREGTEALHQWRGIFAAWLAMISAENPNAFQSFFRSYAQSIVGDSPEIPKALEKIARSLDQHEYRVATLAWMVVAAIRKREAGDYAKPQSG